MNTHPSVAAQAVVASSARASMLAQREAAKKDQRFDHFARNIVSREAPIIADEEKDIPASESIILSGVNPIYPETALEAAKKDVVFGLGLKDASGVAVSAVALPETDANFGKHFKVTLTGNALATYAALQEAAVKRSHEQSGGAQR